MWSRSQRVGCLDLSARERVGIHSEGDTLYCWDEMGDKHIQGQAKAHLLDTYVARLFPSGEVLISGGADMTMRIWSLDHLIHAVCDPDHLSPCAVALTGHAGGILDVSFQDKGRHLTSSSMDGTVKYWDVSTQQCLLTLGADDRKHIPDCVIDSEQQVVWTTSETGEVVKWDLRSQEKVFRYQDGSPLKGLCLLPSGQALVGNKEGQAIRVDSRSGDVVSSKTDLGGGRIESVSTRRCDSGHLFVGLSNGYIRALDVLQGICQDRTDLRPTVEHEPVRHLHARGSNLYWSVGSVIEHRPISKVGTSSEN